MLLSSETLNVIWAVFAVLAGASVNADEAPKPNSTANSKVCETSVCKDEASSFLKSMDPSVKPCDNFYEFVCGKFMKDAVIPDEQPRIFLFDELTNQNLLKLKADLEGDINNNDPRTFKLLQDTYKSCMNTDQLDKDSENELKNILKGLGGWPVLEGDSWNEAAFDWKKTVVDLRKYGYSTNYFIQLSVIADLNDETKRVLVLDQAATGLERDYLVQGPSNEVVSAYFQYMKDVAEILGANPAEAEKQLTESLFFEMLLAHISRSAVDRVNQSTLNNPTTVSKLQEDYKFVPWLEYINDILAPVESIKPSETVTVYEPNFLRNLSLLLEKTPKRMLANYAMWRVVAESASLLSERVRKAEADYLASKTGTTAQEPRWKQCLNSLLLNLYVGLGALYVSRHFDKTMKAGASEIMNNILASYKNILQQADWMDEKTKQAALDKLNAVKSYVGYPEESLDKDKLDGHYKDLSADPNSYLKSYLAYNKFKMAYEFGLLRKPVNKSDWLEYAFSSVADVLYDPTGNAIVVPAGVLQAKMFVKDRPKYMNFAAIGQMMGRQITQGFDSTGSQYDKNGKLQDWWDPETKQKYAERTECIINQYNNYKVEQVNMNINGELTAGDNIADNGGVKGAYFAYLDWEKRNGQEPRLPGLDYSPQQMFWISAASIWCSKYRDEAMKNQLITDVHCPGEFRVIGSMSNRPEFSKDFNCPPDSKMNPQKKCSIW